MYFKDLVMDDFDCSVLIKEHVTSLVVLFGFLLKMYYELKVVLDYMYFPHKRLYMMFPGY